jgi:integrase
VTQRETAQRKRTELAFFRQKVHLRPPMKVSKVEKPYTPFEVFVPKSITGTRRARKYFRSPEEAAAYIVRVKREGFANADNRKAAAEPGKLTVGEVTAMWLARHEDKDGKTKTQVKRVLGSLDLAFGRKAIESISHRELETWLGSVGGGYVNRLNYHRIARRFFGWVHQWLEAIPRNPMVKVRKPEGERNSVEILTPEGMRNCLESVKLLDAPEDLRMTAYLALGGFAGIRTEEILRMSWEDVNWQSGEIYVRQPKKVKGWRPRWVEILPPLRRHLEPIALKDGKVFPGGQRSLYWARRDLMDWLFWEEWPDNCLRHSFKSYHAAEFQSVEKTQLQMGHADKSMTQYQYGTPEARAAAAAWWAL